MDEAETDRPKGRVFLPAVVKGLGVGVLGFGYMVFLGWHNYGWKGLATAVGLIAITALLIALILNRPGRNA